MNSQAPIIFLLYISSKLCGRASAASHQAFFSLDNGKHLPEISQDWSLPLTELLADERGPLLSFKRL